MTVTPEIVSDSGRTVAIVGSRTFPFGQWPNRCITHVDQALVNSGFTVSEVVSGGASGVDSAAAAWTDEVQADVPLVVFEPDWDQYGKQAGPIRNSGIVRAADAVVALWNGTSSGTRDTIAKARHELGDDAVHIRGIGGASPSVTDVSPREL